MSSPSSEEKSRLYYVILFCGIILIAGILSLFIPTRYFVMSPGLAQELSPMITVEEGVKGRTKGDFMLTAVSSRRASVWDFCYLTLIQPEGYELIPIGEELPPGVDMEQYLEQMAELMEESKLQAQAVAFRQAGYEVEVSGDGVEVVDILAGGSAEEKLQDGDIIVEIDGKKVEFAPDAVKLIRRHDMGEEVEITVLRDEEKISYTLQTVEMESAPGKPSIGILITTKNLEYSFPGEVHFETRDIVGPSAGSMFALEIYNQLSPEDITRGRRIAGTGTISSTGEIGRIDGVVQKIMAAENADADMFIVPEENYRDIEDYESSIKLVTAGSIEEVIEYLENH
ncbi:MAG: PDZ domain-containing protein [Halanaerobiales bacterium]